MRVISKVPEGWYERNQIFSLFPANNVQLYRKHKENGSVLYGVSIDKIKVPVPSSLFDDLHQKYKAMQFIEYKYFSEDGSTYRAIDDGKYIVTDLPQ